MPTIRTFIAIAIPDNVQTKIAQLQDELKQEREHISWTKAHNIHLTLKFLGDTDGNGFGELGRGRGHLANFGIVVYDGPD